MRVADVLFLSTRDGRGVAEDGQEWAHVTEKPVPSDDSGDGAALILTTFFFLLAITMLSNG